MTKYFLGNIFVGPSLSEWIPNYSMYLEVFSIQGINNAQQKLFEQSYALFSQRNRIGDAMELLFRFSNLFPTNVLQDQRYWNIIKVQAALSILMHSMDFKAK